MKKGYFQKVVDLTDYIVKTKDPKMKWTWGEALFGYALTLLDDYRKTEEYLPFLSAYCDYYVEHQPVVNQSDTSAPGLITYAMQKKTGKPEYKALTDKVLYYIKNEPRLIEDSLNHLGNSLLGKIYPKSIWVDSLMMFSVFPSLYAKENSDAEMMEIASRQPRVMAKYMMDPEDHLWYHSYWVKQKTHFPRKKIFWGRGNGWVIASLPLILENIGENPERKNIEELYQKTSYALLPYQRPDGTFETIINLPGKTYRELSFTALVAFGWLKGVRMGLLDERFKKAANRAFEACVEALQVQSEKMFMPEISGPTIPLPVFPLLGYRLIPKGKNWSYGLAALIFAAIEYDRQ